VNGKRAVLMNPEVFAKIQAAQVLHEEMVSMFKSKAKGSKAERNAVAAVRDAAVQSSTQQPPSTTSPGEQDAPSDDEPEDDVGDDGMAAQVNSGAEAPLTTASTQLPPQHQAAPPQMADELVGLPRLVGRKVVFGIQGPTMDWLESKVGYESLQSVLPTSPGRIMDEECDSGQHCIGHCTG
jgi:lysozyme family protein